MLFGTAIPEFGRITSLCYSTQKPSSNDAASLHSQKQHLVVQGDNVTRKRLILWISIVAVLVILAISGLVLWRERKERQARIDQRFPLQGLAYCSSNPITPCIVSFSLDADGNMLVSFLTDGAFYPDFYLKVKVGENEHIYVCEKVNTFATSVYCTGQTLPVGEVLQFFLISINGEVLLAQGNFPILGIALAGPEIFLSPTPTDVFSPEATPSPSYPSYPSSRP